MTNLNKRIFTSLIVFPVSMFFIIKGGNYIVSFLYAILILANFEAFSAFKRKTSIIFLDSILVVSLLSILHLRNDTASSLILLLWVIILTISSDIGGYIFGKIFKGPKLTKISPNKTYAGVFGSFLLSLMAGLIYTNYFGKNEITNSDHLFILLLIIFISLISQIGDLIISYFKRKAKIKDTGKILPGHGGLLDRIDGMIFVFPFCYLIKMI